MGDFEITPRKSASTCKDVQPAVNFLIWNYKALAPYIRGGMCADVEWHVAIATMGRGGS